MLNEDKIKLMTSISMLEKKEGKYLFPVRQYFRSDYIEKNLLKALIGYTFCWILGGTLVSVSYTHLEDQRLFSSPEHLLKQNVPHTEQYQNPEPGSVFPITGLLQ